MLIRRGLGRGRWKSAWLSCCVLPEEAAARQALFLWLPPAFGTQVDCPYTGIPPPSKGWARFFGFSSLPPPQE